MKSLILIRHFELTHHFFWIWHSFTFFVWQHKKQTQCKRNIAKKLAGYREKPITILAAILDFRRHIGFDKKLFFYKICLILIETKNWKRNVKMLQTHWVIVENYIFGHFEKWRHLENLWFVLANFFLNESSYYWSNSSKK